MGFSLVVMLGLLIAVPSDCGAQLQVRRLHQLWLSGSGAQLQVRRLHQLWLSGSGAQTGSVVTAHELSFSTRGTWDLPGPGIESVRPALAGRFFATEPPNTQIRQATSPKVTQLLELGLTPD